MSRIEEAFRIADVLAAAANKLDVTELDQLMKAAEKIGKSFCDSWLGYHSRIYYKDFQPVPPGARFSKEWGTMTVVSKGETIGNWSEYDFDGVVDVIHEMAGGVDLDAYNSLVEETKELFEESKSTLMSILTTALQEAPNDGFLKDLSETIKKERVFSTENFVKLFAPSGRQMSRDMNALQAGFQTPPHISVIAQISSIRSPFTSCENLSKLALRAASHLQNLCRKSRREERIGTNVFIGHGCSRVWKNLKDFVKDRLHLPWDEFNRVSVAGVTNIARLSRTALYP